MNMRNLLIIPMFAACIACSDQSRQQQDSTPTTETSPQMDTRKSPQTSTGGETESTTPSGNENRPTPAPAN
ncbi:hypothetical protein M8997_000680 [Phyllobacterium sp. 21LDTY02-6]|jgi:hypothetical protein|uniref:hypothetical protein n=1 Tax=unclassified Phyllobacterium TaxID=2638441 RepID=UPI002021A3E0|nr:MULTISPECIES: hypothetical protein [unclassified Phyllobacterium]MCO4315681.1 hypothetical protein [Phyllobacterium sp. 21LDTY02-6]MCX8280907.1 hypothetical protein [Phyllobacterium sp. 0TCS1.6C]MCX8295773.1 hypothetical protein [Phyllobacterium sp. 0TCS1.6A]